MKTPWHDNRFVVQMPHMAPGERLSEVEFLKLLAAYQWSGIAHMLGRKPSEITSDSRERLYGSVIDVETKLADQHSMEILGEDAEIRVRNRVTSYAKKFVEGLFVIDDHDIPDSLLAALGSQTPLEAIPTSAWPTPARRPRNTALASERSGGIVLPDWRDGVRDFAAAVARP